MSGRIEDRLRELSSSAVLEPRAGLEAQVLGAMAEAAAERPRRVARYAARAAAVAVLAGTGALLAMWTANREAPVERASVAGQTDTTYLDLIEQTARLEQLAVLIPAPRRVMRADTASTIVGLEDRIALIDVELQSPNAAEPSYRDALLRDRVELMNALVNVRYAQSRAFIF